MKLLLKFFSNAESQAYLRGLADEFGESTNAVRVELNRLSDAGLLESSSNGRTKLYRANIRHPLFPELHSVVKKFLGIDKLVENVISKLGSVEIALVTGDYAKGIDSGIIDVVLVGDIDKEYMNYSIMKAEEIIKRKIRPFVLSYEEFERLKDKLGIEKALVVWTSKDKLP